MEEVRVKREREWRDCGEKRVKRERGDIKQEFSPEEPESLRGKSRVKVSGRALSPRSDFSRSGADSESGVSSGSIKIEPQPFSPEPEPGAEAELKTELKPEPGPKPEPKAEPKPEPGPKAEPDPVSGSGAEADSQFGSAAQTFMDPEHLRKYSCEVLLDPNSAFKRLLVSDDRLSVTCVKKPLPYPNHEDRFVNWLQVLSSGGLWGRCYWEVDWRLGGGEEGVGVAVSYRGISRRGRGECAFGYNPLSWALRITQDVYYVHHNRIITKVRDKRGVRSGSVSVFLDSEAGALTFYELVNDGRLRLLHTFTSSFSEPLFPGFRLFKPGDSVSLVKL